MLKVPAIHYAGQNVPKPAIWDPMLNNMTGGWSSEGCHLKNYYSNLIFFHCNRLGYYGLLQDKSYYSADGKRQVLANYFVDLILFVLTLLHTSFLKNEFLIRKPG